jgi:NitT/TauT family transport system permease protein
MTTAKRTDTFWRRVRRFRSARAAWIRVACYASSIILLLGVWQALGRSFGVLFVPFTTTMSQLWEMVHGGPLLPALGVSAKLYGVTLIIDIVVGVSVGLVLARMKLIAAALEPYVYVLYATPTISLVPFISVMFGFEFWSRVLVSVVISIFPILLGTLEGARSMPRQHLDVAAIFGSNERQLLQGTTIIDSAWVLAVTVFVAAIAVVLVGIGELIERYLVRWRHTAVG